jgi:hypothetical protein
LDMIKTITIAHTPGCPHIRVAQQRVEVAIAELGGPPLVVVVEEIGDPDEARRRDFRGSPALIVDGIDLFAAPTDAAAFACRTYTTEAGREGSPSVSQIVHALRSTEGC